MGKRIVAINDDTIFLNLLRELLSEEGYDAYLCNEGAEAYQRVLELNPDAIILDIRMEKPETGWKVLELLKLDPLLGQKPIIVCSADMTQLQDRAVYLKSKGCEILSKPFDLNDLLTMLTNLIGGPE